MNAYTCAPSAWPFRHEMGRRRSFCSWPLDVTGFPLSDTSLSCILGLSELALQRYLREIPVARSTQFFSRLLSSLRVVVYGDSDNTYCEGRMHGFVLGGRIAGILFLFYFCIYVFHGGYSSGFGASCGTTGGRSCKRHLRTTLSTYSAPLSAAAQVAAKGTSALCG